MSSLGLSLVSAVSHATWLTEAATMLVCAATAAALAVQTRRRAAATRELAVLTERVAEFKQAALIDHVTGLKNRTAFSRDLEVLLEEADPGEIAVLFLDLDRFKEVNDTLGHKVGDGLL